ncbi:MAG: hypothetical protein AB7K67_00390 [Hyphomicrobiaceae bacterium]
MRIWMTTWTTALAASAAVIAAAGPALADARTTRIETRPFYGATVTIEEGVRVFRPLPPHDRVIINPGNKANISLGFSEQHVYSYAPPAVVNVPSVVRRGSGGYGYFVPHRAARGYWHGHGHAGGVGGPAR